MHQVRRCSQTSSFGGCGPTQPSAPYPKSHHSNTKTASQKPGAVGTRLHCHRHAAGHLRLSSHGGASGMALGQWALGMGHLQSVPGGAVGADSARLPANDRIGDGPPCGTRPLPVGTTPTRHVGGAQGDPSTLIDRPTGPHPPGSRTAHCSPPGPVGCGGCRHQASPRPLIQACAHSPTS